MQSALRLIYPPQCISCGGLVDSEFGLCGRCWRDTPFILGLSCDKCGVPLPGEGDGAEEFCDECLRVERPWSRGRAALIYRDNARKLVLSLKHGDRQDIARPAAGWMARRAVPIVRRNMLVAPVPLHWSRLLKRRYNQSALLARGVAEDLGLSYCVDLLQRRQKTPSLSGLSPDERFAALDGCIVPHPKRRHRMAGRAVLLVDDVLTSGATLSASAEACRASGAAHISVLVLARVAKDT